MKKGLVIIGILLLLAGLVSISTSNVKQNKIDEQPPKVAQETWNISDNFQKGENLTLAFQPGWDWNLYPYLPPDVVPNIPPIYEVKQFTVNITNIDAGQYTLIDVTLGRPAEEGPRESFLRIYEIDIVHHGAIRIGDSPEQITGTAKNDGVYQVNCWLTPSHVIDQYANGTITNRKVNPPAELRLVRTIIEDKNPYGFLLPVGGTLSIAGVILSVWGAKTHQHD